MNANIPYTNKKRIVIVGAGFGGLALARALSGKQQFQIVLIDKNNYHQFQPLLYQVATAGLEPSAISFPLRKIFHKKKDIHIRTTEVESVQSKEKTILTGLGEISYDYLVLALGADTNYFGMKNVMEKSIPMKSVSEALDLRNKILQNFEDALSCNTEEETEQHMNILVVGGGATGTEVSGTLSEMKKSVLPNDFPELNFDKMNIFLVEASPKVLGPMSSVASQKAKEYLEKLGVKVLVSTHVTDYDGKQVWLSDGSKILSNTLIWAAGVKANRIEGLSDEVFNKTGRMIVNRYNQVVGEEFIFSLGDMAAMAYEKYPVGHPQVAQPAIQQGELLAKNLIRKNAQKEMIPFEYKDLGSMATIGKNLAVVDLPFWKFQGFFAWLVWMFVHLMSIIGVKNRLFIFINWSWNYFTSDQSLRLIIKPKRAKS